MIQVDNIHIKVAGMNEAEASMFGRRVAESMVTHLDNVESKGERRIDELTIKLTEGGTNENLADEIALRLVKQLNIS